ncbi:hypothetical protein [Pararobbsia alpina]|uniref:Uncharacterized protein n=1 Tax=Pararobbsia alpina TaxID=621374 RepID=A0A6S7B1C8_9BURK|nr:hypothetical protein [Pararobbsia alpina]CAB3784578.1 hypothetical protein LMG28138_01837 [Pararobbsia alpina]
MAITYQADEFKTDVRLDGKKIGEIRKVPDGFQYFPKGQKKGGFIYSTQDNCRKSLEES